MSARPVRTGPLLSKRERANKHEKDKADKALGSGIVIQGSAQKTPHFNVEIQWFRLLRGQKRLDSIARIFVELAPLKVFDPRDIYAQHQKNDATKENLGLGADESAGHAKQDKKGVKKTQTLSKKAQFIQANQLKKQKEAASRDSEKLRTISDFSDVSSIKVETDLGRMELLLCILKHSLKEPDVVGSLDTLWEIQEVSKELDTEDLKKCMKPFLEDVKRAKEIMSSRTHLSGLNLIDFQLVKMSDRLPPLNLRSLRGKFKLDAWQLNVIDLINQKKSVLVTAPTSSGKTVLSTYVCTSGARVLFVVPSEPLAWQVAAMLRALKLNIGLAVPTLDYVPSAVDAIVGTPHALETCLTTKAGFHFDYAVFDEVHSLNNSDGAALQRLIRVVPKSCKVLALSATIGNAPDLLRWWESIVGKGEIHHVAHSTRYINLQRHIWVHEDESTSSEEQADVGKDSPENDAKKSNLLCRLHPVLSFDTNYLGSSKFLQSDVPFTPIDTYNLFKAMEALIPADSEIDIKDLKPKTYFASRLGRITLMTAKEYEDEVKKRLSNIARVQPSFCKLLISSLSPDVDLKELKKLRKKAIATEGIDMEKFDCETADRVSTEINEVLEKTKNSTSNDSLTDLCFELFEKERLPGIMFQLDSVRCQSLFDGLLRTLESREAEKYPEYKDGLARQAKEHEKLMQKMEKRAHNIKKTTDDDVAEAQEFAESGKESIDLNAPHPEFVLAPPGRSIVPAELKSILDKLREYQSASSGELHPLIRGLRRGIGLYIEGLPSTYHRIVQSLAQQGRLGIVMSDELLAYGVNMPFRSCIFFGDPGEEWLTPLMHQQMAGRAGRRGLDRQGHLVYAGFSPARVRSLLRGQLPDIVGRFPLYPTIRLQLPLHNQFKMEESWRLTEAMVREMCSTPLAEFLRGESTDNYYECAGDWMNRLGVMSYFENISEDDANLYQREMPQLIWKLRGFLPESLAIAYSMEYLIRKFAQYAREAATSSAQKKGEKEQAKVFLHFCLMCARKPYSAKSVEIMKLSAVDDAPRTSALSRMQPLPFPAPNDKDWEDWCEVVAQSQERIIKEDLPHKKEILLDHYSEPQLDNMCYSAFVRNQIDPNLPTPLQHDVRVRMWNIGEVMRICSNHFGKYAILSPVCNLIRKSFVRIRYILDETAERNWAKAVVESYEPEELELEEETNDNQ